MPRAKSRVTKAVVKMKDRRIAELSDEVDKLRARVGQLSKERNNEIQGRREELNQYLLAGMLLMREVMLAKIRKYGPDLTNAGMPRVGVKALAKYVDTGLLHLNPESLKIFADRLVELLEAQALDTGHPAEEIDTLSLEIYKQAVEQIAQKIDEDVMATLTQ